MKTEKLIKKLLSNPIPSEMDYRDVKKILEHEGWRLDRIRGSHHIFVNNGDTMVLPIQKGIVKRTYLKEEIIKKLNLEDKYGEE